MREYVCRRMCYEFGRRWRVGDVLEAQGVLKHDHFMDLPKRFTPREALIEADVISRDDHLGKTKRIQISDGVLFPRDDAAGAEPRGEPEVPLTMREIADAQGLGGDTPKRGRGRPPKPQHVSSV